MHPETKTVYSVYGNHPSIKNSLELIKNETPATEWINTIPSYSFWWVINQYEWYMQTGDEEYLSEQIDYLVTGELLIPKDREADEVVKQLPFRHAMGAVAFRFYTDEVELKETVIESIILTLNYNHTTLKLSLADGTFQGDFSNEEGYAYQIFFEDGTTVNYPSGPTAITPIAPTMLVPGDEFKITQLILYYYQEDGRESKTLDTSITVEAGKTTVLNIKCQQKAEGTTPQLIVDKTGNASSELPPL
jgi:hypothetical protein